MAIWHFKAWVVPQKILGSTDRRHADRVEPTALAGAWLGAEIQPIAEQIELLELKSSKSWSSKILVWGDEDRMFVRILQDAGQIVEIELGLDAREVVFETCVKVSKFLDSINARLVSTDGSIVGRGASGIAQALRTSDAWRFVVDPGAFLGELTGKAKN
jgi:hypothetical protein